MSDQITFKCSKCGSDEFEIPTNPKPNDMITCAGCGCTGKYGEVRKEAIKQSKEAVEKMLRDTLKKAGFK